MDPDRHFKRDQDRDETPESYVDSTSTDFREAEGTLSDTRSTSIPTRLLFSS